MAQYPLSLSNEHNEERPSGLFTLLPKASLNKGFLNPQRLVPGGVLKECTKNLATSLVEGISWIAPK